MTNTKQNTLILDSDRDPIFWLFPTASVVVSPGFVEALSALAPRLPSLPNLFKFIDDFFKAQKPVVPRGSTLKPEAGDISKFSEYAKPIYATLLSVAFMTFLLNLHTFLPRRVYDGGAPPDKTVDILTALYTLAHAVESFTGVQISEGLLEGVNEAFGEAFQYLLTNPITKLYALYFGLENADDDEIKDIANSGGISNDTMTYIALMSGLSNVATIAEIATGYLYAVDNSIRNVFRKLNDYADNSLDIYLKEWQWFFNRLISELTEWLTTVGQAAVFHTQRLREIGKRYVTAFTEHYALFLRAEQNYNKAVIEGNEATADRYLLDMHNLYNTVKTLADAMEQEARYVASMFDKDYQKLVALLDTLIAKIDAAVGEYSAVLRAVALKMFQVMNFYIRAYIDDMQEVIDTVARYRSPHPEITKANFEFVAPFEPPQGAEVVDETA